MTKTFPRYASAEFQIGTGNETITVENVPCEWNPAKGDMDSQCVLAVATYIGEHNLTHGKPVTLIWTSSIPA